eukprot:CAMPEP_0119094280 /NCGR_PEP_ID=MMETSP1178-20130426/165775_1 /TAXON_ID=33656 /ORGANISM="unid sp, Strain CCMP2000" /LENGTH=30 /DNA_ID= /DNA_START= /DNA_END= /DNA_ORIENTATION=
MIEQEACPQVRGSVPVTVAEDVTTLAVQVL